MTTPHKCAEILRAIADGKPVQFRLTNTARKKWEDLDTKASFSYQPRPSNTWYCDG